MVAVQRGGYHAGGEEGGHDSRLHGGYLVGGSQGNCEVFETSKALQAEKDVG